MRRAVSLACSSCAYKKPLVNGRHCTLHPFSNKLLWKVKSSLELNFLSLKCFSFLVPLEHRFGFFFYMIPFSRTFTIFYLFSTSSWFLSAPWNTDSGGQSFLQQNLLSCTQRPSDWGAHAASPHQCSSPLQSQSVPPRSGPWCLSQTCHSCSVQRKQRTRLLSTAGTYQPPTELLRRVWVITSCKCIREINID